MRTACPVAGLEGTLKFISPETDPVTGQVRVWAEIDNARAGFARGSKGG